MGCNDGLSTEKGLMLDSPAFRGRLYKMKSDQISGSHGSDYDDTSFLGCNAVLSDNFGGNA
jgi:hypothetical protein